MLLDNFGISIPYMDIGEYTYEVNESTISIYGSRFVDDMAYLYQKRFGENWETEITDASSPSDSDSLRAVSTKEAESKIVLDLFQFGTGCRIDVYPWTPSVGWGKDVEDMMKELAGYVLPFMDFYGDSKDAAFDTTFGCLSIYGDHWESDMPERYAEILMATGDAWECEIDADFWEEEGADPVLFAYLDLPDVSLMVHLFGEEGFAELDYYALAF